MYAEPLQPWVEIQKKTFTNWINMHLKVRNKQIEDLAVALSDGVNLVCLLEQVSSKKLVPAKTKPPRNHAQKLENVSIALNFLTKEGIKLVGIGPEDVVECRIKLILGLIWTIILRWQLQLASVPASSATCAISVKHELLKWLNAVIPDYTITNLSIDWHNGKLLAELTNLICPGSVTDCNNPIDLVTQAVKVAEEQRIPALIDPEDIVSPNLDEMSMMTYIALFRDRYNLKLEQDEQDDIHYHSPESSGKFYDIVKLTLRESIDVEDFNVLSSAKQFALHVKWVTNVDILIKEFQAGKITSRLHDIRCKATIDDQIQRTNTVKPNGNVFVWNQMLKFETLEDPDINILLYCANKFFPNEKLGRITIPKNQLAPGDKVAKKLPIETHGFLSLSITQSKQFIAPFKFSISRCDNSIFLKDVTTNIKFRMTEGSNFQFELYDWQDNCIFDIAVLSFPKPVVDIYRYGASKPIYSIPLTGSKCYILGIQTIDWIELGTSHIKYVRLSDSDVNSCLGSIHFTKDKVVCEITPSKGFVMVLASLLSLLDFRAI